MHIKTAGAYLWSCPVKVQAVFRVEEEDIRVGFVVTDDCLECVELEK